MLPSMGRADGLPEWAEQVVSRPNPEWSTGAPAVILHLERIVTVPRSGRIVVVERRATRVLTDEGASRAECHAYYLRKTSAVRELRGWVVGPRGIIERIDKGDAADLATAADFTLYSDVRKLFARPRAAPPGTVVVWEYVREDEPLVAQWEWTFQLGVPVLVSRMSITLPPGMEPVARIFGRDSVTAVRGERTWTWEAGNLRAFQDEWLASPGWSEVSSMRVDVPAGDGSPGGESFAGWPEVARWLYEIAARADAADGEVAVRAAAITTAKQDTLARLRALAAEVQQFNYVSKELGLGRGGGYRPNPPGDVLRLRYGDCKDKANVLRALAAAAGHRAWLVSVHSEGRDAVDPRWPSPIQFDHCIIAIAAPRAVALPSVVEHPGLGPMILFDPTDPLTVFGDLPSFEQGAWGLLEDPASGGLLRMPIAPDEANRLERTIEAELDETGGLTARLTERSVGQHAVVERRLHRTTGERQYREILERWLAGVGRSVDLRDFACSEDSVAGAFSLDASLAAPGFARIAQGRLMSFSPAIVRDRNRLIPPDTARTWPVALEASCVAETVTVRLPPGFAVDEIPGPIHLQRDFGSLDAEWRVVDDRVRFTRRWTVRPVTLPPARYREVRELFAANVSASRALIVLLRR